MVNIKKESSLDKIRNIIKNDMLCLSYGLLDAQLLVGEEIDIDKIESQLLNQNTYFSLNEAKKDYNKSNKKTYYKLEIDVYFNDKELTLYRVKDWFVLDDNVFVSGELYAEQEAM